MRERFKLRVLRMIVTYLLPNLPQKKRQASFSSVALAKPNEPNEHFHKAILDQAKAPCIILHLMPSPHISAHFETSQPQSCLPGISPPSPFLFPITNALSQTRTPAIWGDADSLQLLKRLAYKHVRVAGSQHQQINMHAPGETPQFKPCEWALQEEKSHCHLSLLPSPFPGHGSQDNQTESCKWRSPRHRQALLQQKMQ